MRISDWSSDVCSSDLGGGFISGSAASHGQMYAHLAKAVGCQALVLDYPLAPEEPFPAAPDACLLAYRLLSAGPDAPRIILVGDSAGDPGQSNDSSLDRKSTRLNSSH